MAIILLAMGTGSGAGCERPTSPPPRALTVLAAASLNAALTEAARGFETAEAGAAVTCTFGASNQLRAQLEAGAPGDVFASADQAQMDAAIAAKTVEPDTVMVFAINHLIVVTAPGRPVGGLEDLADPGLRVVIAEAAVPLGAYTARMLDLARGQPGLGAAFVAGFEANIVSREQSAAAVVMKVRLGEADAGIAYASDATGASGLGAVELPPAVAQRAEYVVGACTKAASPAGARRFIGYLISREGQGVLRRHGLGAIEGAVPGESGPSRQVGP